MSELKLHFKREDDEVEISVDYTGNYVATIRNLATLQYALMDKLVKDGNAVVDVTTEMLVVMHEMMYSYVKDHEPEALFFVETMGQVKEDYN